MNSNRPMIAAIYARADVWLRRAVRMAGEVTDRALRIPYVKGTVRLPAILFTVSAVPSGGKPPGTQRGVRPASLARIFLITVQLASRGNYSEDGDKDRARGRAAAVLPLLPASAEVTLEVLACGRRRRWHRGRRTGAMSSHASRVRGASRTWEERGRECDRPRPRPLGLLSRDACLRDQSS